MPHVRGLLIILVSLGASLSGCGDGSGDDPVLPGPEISLAGTLDPSFGGQGTVTTPVGDCQDHANAVAIQPDGKIVVAGSSFNGSVNDIVVVRYDADGSLDASFGSGGKVTTDIAGEPDEACCIALQSDGKILVAGHSSISGWGYMVMARYTDTGSLDSTFDGDGIVIGDSHDQARSMAVLADGRIVVAGYTYNGTIYQVAVLRYHSDGSRDMTFDSDGKVTTQVGPDWSFGMALAIQPTGEIVVGGNTCRHENGSESGRDFAVVRYTADGSLDAGFGIGGMQITNVAGEHEWGRSLVLQEDGKIILAGTTITLEFGYAFAAVRYLSDGSLDPAYGDGGIVISDIGPWSDEAWAVAVQPDGKSILAGYTANTYDTDIGLARYNIDGSLDGTFGGDGRVTTAVGPQNDHFTAVAIAADGKIVAVGFSYSGTDDDFLIARYFN